MKHRTWAKHRLRLYRIIKNMCCSGGLVGALVGGLVGYAMSMAYQNGISAAFLWVMMTTSLGALFGVAAMQMLQKIQAPEYTVVFTGEVEHQSPLAESLHAKPTARVSAIRIEPGQDLLEVLRRSHPQKMEDNQSFHTALPPLALTGTDRPHS